MSSTPPTSASRLVLIPSYNSGAQLLRTVTMALEYWRPIWVVVDGSTDGSAERLERLQVDPSWLRVLRLPANRGKGAAVLEGLRAAAAQGFSHALVMDADGQHPADRIGQLMALSLDHPGAMILGEPVFGTDAPASRKYGRRIGNWWTNLETLWGGINDSLFGFRVYPIQLALEILESISVGQRYDFDTQLAVRLYWRGTQPVNVEVPVTYLRPDEGGVSHFHYVRDNLLLVLSHCTLVPGMLMRFPSLLRRRLRA